MAIHSISELSGDNGNLIQLFHYEEQEGISFIQDSKITTINLHDYGEDELKLLQRHITQVMIKKREDN